ncbi:MAG: hypothetical protein LLF94_06010 [Chlamydiales bacterium]|nr:hypothetical protein [Chlamydiales bacterium]
MIYNNMIETRAVFELGSGCIRLQVAKVDSENKKIVQVHLSHYAHVNFAKDVQTSADSTFSTKIMDEAITQLIILKDMAGPFEPTKYRGIATEAFRCSKNAQVLIERIRAEVGIDIEIATHQEEAMYGFYNAMSLSELESHTIISWDSGAGSFQITAHDEMFLGRFGRTPVQHYIVEVLQGRDFSQTASPNPISKKEALATIDYIKSQLKDCPKTLLAKLNREDLVIVSIGAHPKLIPIGATYTREFIKECLFDNLDKSDEELDMEEAQFIVSDLILAYSVMSALDIKQAVRYSTRFAGNTSGLLIDTNLWSKQDLQPVF